MDRQRVLLMIMFLSWRAQMPFKFYFRPQRLFVGWSGIPMAEGGVFVPKGESSPLRSETRLQVEFPMPTALQKKLTHLVKHSTEPTVYLIEYKGRVRSRANPDRSYHKFSVKSTQFRSLREVETSFHQGRGMLKAIRNLSKVSSKAQ